MFEMCIFSHFTCSFLGGGLKLRGNIDDAGAFFFFEFDVSQVYL